MEVVLLRVAIFMVPTPLDEVEIGGARIFKLVTFRLAANEFPENHVIRAVFVVLEMSPSWQPPLERPVVVLLVSTEQFRVTPVNVLTVQSSTSERVG